MFYSFSMSFKLTILGNALKIDIDTLSIIGMPIELLKLTNKSK